MATRIKKSSEGREKEKRDVAVGFCQQRRRGKFCTVMPGRGTPVRTTQPPTIGMQTVLGQVGTFDAKCMSWSEYVEILEHFLALNSITEESRKRSFLLTSVGPETYHVVRGLCQPENPRDKTFGELCTLLSSHFSPRPSEIVERFRFNSRNRKPEESVQEYLTELRRLSEHCEFGNTLDNMLRDRIVCGINNVTIQRKLLAEVNLTLKRAVTIALAQEAASKDLGDLQRGNNASTVSTETVHHVKKQNQAKKSFPKKGQSVNECWRCGGTHSARRCRFIDERCFKCQQKGHVGKRCAEIKKWRDQHYVAEDTDEITDENTDSQNYVTDCDDEYVFHVSDNRVLPFQVKAVIGNKTVTFEVDTGCGVTLVPKHAFESFGGKMHELKPCKTKLKTYTGDAVKVVGETVIRVKIQGVEKELPLLVVENGGPNLLGRNWFVQFDMSGLVQDLNYQSESNRTLSEILREHDGLFKEGLGTLKGFEAKIHVEKDVQPKFYKARPVSYALQNKVDVELERLRDQGVLEPVKFSEWATPVVPVLKANGNVRLCGDYKVTVNQVSHVEQYPIPRLEDLLVRLGGGKTFSKLDLSHAYNQIRLDEESSKLLTVNTQKGLFKVNRLPFGVSSAPAIFQRTIENLVKDIPNVVVYLDDILISGENEVAHLRNVDAVLSRLREAGLRLKKDKCCFQVKEVVYLGHKIDSEGVHPLEQKIEAIQKVPEPKSVTELQAYLGLLNYYHGFLPQISTVLAPLHELLQKGHVWRWGSRHKQAFEKSKSLLQSYQVRVHYRSDLPLVVSCDASGVGLGAILSHVMPDGKERPISFASRSLSKAERNYSTLDREACAVMFGIRKFHKYLLGRRFTIITDHKPLIYLLSEKNNVPQMTSTRRLRWIIELGAYDYSIEHKSGKLHLNADSLSRLPVGEAMPEKREENIFLMQQLETAPINADQIRGWTAKDPVLSKVKSYILRGWPSQLEEPDLKPYFARKLELSVEDGIVLWGTRVIVPPQGRQKVLEELHVSHPGMTRMKGLARGYLWWPRLDDAIENKVKLCNECLEHQRAPAKAPVHPWEIPSKPWSRVHVDYAGPIEGKMIFVMIDAYSKWIEAEVVSGSTSQITIERLRHIIAAQGIPEIIVSDNAACFTGQEFQEYCKQNGIRHVAGAPFHPSTNGLAEKAVQIVKLGLKKGSGSLQERMDKLLFSYRLTPQSTTEHAPCELLNKRKLRSRLDLIRPDVHARLTKKQEEQRNASEGTVRSFKENEVVIVRNYGVGPKWLRGVIVSQEGPLLYSVELHSGKIVKRHIDQIKNGFSEIVHGNREVLPQNVSARVDVPVSLDGTEMGTEVNVEKELEQRAVTFENVEPPQTSDNVGSRPGSETVQHSPAKLRVSHRERRVPKYLDDYVQH